MGWQDEHSLDHRRRLRNGSLVSLAVHGLVFATLVISPPRTAPPLPEVLSVDLVAAPPAARSAPKATPKATPKSTPKATPKAAPKAEPKPAPEPPPPPPPVKKAPVQALPENSPSQIREVEPKPKVAKKPEPKPEAASRPQRRVREKELSYEDAMAALGEEVGPEEDPDLLQAPTEATASESTGSPTPNAGVVVSQELVAWATATTRRIQNTWKDVASYQGRGLATTLELELSSTGEVLGTPRVMRSSGDPYFDDNAVRAVLMGNPLPPPPRAGATVFVFRSEE